VFLNFGTWFKKIQNFPEKFHQQISDKIKQTFSQFTQPKLCKQFSFDKKNFKTNKRKNIFMKIPQKRQIFPLFLNFQKFMNEKYFPIFRLGISFITLFDFRDFPFPFGYGWRNLVTNFLLNFPGSFGFGESIFEVFKYSISVIVWWVFLIFAYWVPKFLFSLKIAHWVFL
jgi:hypothetical protein